MYYYDSNFKNCRFGSDHFCFVCSYNFIIRSKKMKNIQFKTFVFISIFVLFFIVGCGGGGSDSNPVSSQNTNGSINQNFVGNWYIVKDEGREVYSNTKLKVEYSVM